MTFCHRGNLTACKWKDKREVLMLTTKHAATWTEVTAKRKGVGATKKQKPEIASSITITIKWAWISTIMAHSSIRYLILTKEVDNARVTLRGLRVSMVGVDHLLSGGTQARLPLGNATKTIKKHL
ncbi:hypothetical protein EVAR_88949_1 [Eumeta japonica]|uniref:Uncharacterized protein n=1 Tax=Eumeta variegata TaxID=151549 RepID=A0A4C1VP53_EUMVA|nr:hypothetical protein EVAR_88949_1 [Eumeta japonica]